MNTPHIDSSPGDFYDIIQLLTPAQQEIVRQVRAFMQSEVVPVINHYWSTATFPHELVPKIGELGIAGSRYSGYGCPGHGNLFEGLLTLEITRHDPSMGTFFLVQSGLAMGSIYLLGSEEQKNHWLPKMHRMEAIGSFGLTEPDVGSGISRGLATSAQRDGDSWILNGEKLWIGNSPFAEVNVIFARDEADGQVKGFLVEKGTPGLRVETQKDKIALRVVQNGHIYLENCRVADSQRLPKATSFRSVADVLRMTRADVAWQAVGIAMGAYEHALEYAKRREQFGRPIATFQLIQDKLAQMLGYVVSAQCMVLRLSQMQAVGEIADEKASLAKSTATVYMRQAVALARELQGGNGILLEHNVARFFADAEALYSYEGTRDINSLIVGRAVTGYGAFV